ncbi:MAG: hypothetical protein JRJ62_13800 [Deltaproteobacteria bacterium]|nr:hypothetical protein [Deltaproteobacteria bacterium]
MKTKLKLFVVILLTIFCIGCVSLKPTVTVDSQNMFTSTSPNLQLILDRSLKYAGHFEILQREQGWSYNNEYYIFNNGSKILSVILIKRIPFGSDYHWLPIKIKKGENGVLIVQKTVKLAGKYWKTYIQEVSLNTKEADAFYSKGIDVERRYIAKCYARNISDKIHVRVLYAETLEGYEDDIKQYRRLNTLTNEQAELLNSFLERAEKSITFIK